MAHGVAVLDTSATRTLLCFPVFDGWQPASNRKRKAATASKSQRRPGNPLPRPLARDHRVKHGRTRLEIQRFTARSTVRLRYGRRSYESSLSGCRWRTLSALRIRKVAERSADLVPVVENAVARRYGVIGKCVPNLVKLKIASDVT